MYHETQARSDTGRRRLLNTRVVSATRAPRQRLPARRATAIVEGADLCSPRDRLTLVQVWCRALAVATLVALSGCAEGSTVIEEPDVDGGGTTSNGDGGPCVPTPDPAEGGGTCSDAISLGTLQDAAGDSSTVIGNALPGGRETWWSFMASDDVDTDGDEFHVDIRFLDNPGNAYYMAVYRGNCSTESLVSDPEETDTFDWYTDFPTTDVGCTFENEAPCGEGDCAPAPGEEGRNICDDDTSMFYFVVSRADGDASCEGFEIEVSNGQYAADG